MRARAIIAALPAVLAAGALPVAAAGCSSDGPAGALDPVARAAETTIRAGGAQVTMTASGQVLGQTLTMSGHGTVNLSDEEGEVFVSMSGLPSSVPGLTAGRLEMTALETGHAMYVGSPLFEGKLPAGARWLKIDLGRVAESLGLDPADITSGGEAPGRYLQLLRAAGSVRDAGPAVVRGVPTTRYVATVDLRKAAEVLPAPDRAAAEGAISKLIAQIGTSSYPVEVWVDSHQMIRRIEMQMPLSTGGQHASMSLQEELFGFGPTPSITAPAASETYEAPVPSLGG